MSRLEDSDSGAGGDPFGLGLEGGRRPDARIAERLLAHLDPQPGGRYLDLGCGTGDYTILLAAAGLSMAGVDPSEAALDVARRRAPDIEWRRCSLEALPFPDQCFDGALCVLATHHLEDLGRACAEVGRVVGRGRVVAMTAAPEQVERYWLAHYFPVAMRRAAAALPPVSELVDALAGAGLELAAMEPWEVPPDLVDLLLFSGKHRPTLYLDPQFRAGIPSFARLAPGGEVAEGLDRLAEDLCTGRFDEVAARYRHDEGDYLFIVAERGR